MVRTRSTRGSVRFVDERGPRVYVEALTREATRSQSQEGSRTEEAKGITRRPYPPRHNRRACFLLVCCILREKGNGGRGSDIGQQPLSVRGYLDSFCSRLVLLRLFCYC